MIVLSLPAWSTGGDRRSEKRFEFEKICFQIENNFLCFEYQNFFL